MFLDNIPKSSNEQEDSQESNESIDSKIDKLEETRERKLRVKSGTLITCHALCWRSPETSNKMVHLAEQ